MDLTQKEVRRIFSYNEKTGILRWRVSPAKNVQIGDIAGTFNDKGYLKVRIEGKDYYVHRIIWLYVHGYLPEGQIDHKDRIKHHNWILNLREASNQCNQRNKSVGKNNKTGIKGVHFCNTRKKYKVYIGLNGKQRYVGISDNFDEAVCLRLAAEQCIGWSGCDSSSPAYKHVNSF